MGGMLITILTTGGRTDDAKAQQIMSTGWLSRWFDCACALCYRPDSFCRRGLCGCFFGGGGGHLRLPDTQRAERLVQLDDAIGDLTTAAANHKDGMMGKSKQAAGGLRFL